MSTLAALLELVHGAHDHVRTFQAEYRDWSHPLPTHELVVGFGEDGRKRAVGWRGAGPWAKEAVTTRRIWLERPDRLRVEIWNGPQLVRVGVRDGIRWWRWDRPDGPITGELAESDTEAELPPLLRPLLLSPAVVAASVRLKPAGRGIRAGREVLVAHASPRGGLPREVSVELEFDVENGTLLRRAVSKNGRVVQSAEAIEARFDRSIDHQRFVFISPDDKAAQALRPTVRDQLPTMRATSRLGTQVPRSAMNEREDHTQSVRPGGTVWLTGIPAAGKTTLARATQRTLAKRGVAACVLDGDLLRQGLSSDLGLSAVDRAEQARRAAHVAALISQAGVVAIVALVSPFAEDRRRAREIHDRLGLPFFEAWVDTPLAVCEQRDPKGLYARARAGQLQELTGVGAPYERPKAPELRVPGHGQDPDAVARRIVDVLPIDRD